MHGADVCIKKIVCEKYLAKGKAGYCGKAS